MAGRKREPNSIRETARRLTGELGFNVTPKMVMAWRGKGFDLNDIPGLIGKLRNQERLPRGARGKLPKPETPKIEAAPPAKKKAAKKKAADPEPKEPEAPAIDESDVEKQLQALYDSLLVAPDLHDAQKIRAQISGVRDILKELREQGRYILKADAIKDGSVAALAVRGELEKLEDALPPLLEGRTSLQMKSKIRDYSRGVMLELTRIFS
jgi:ribosomal protein S25